MLRYLQVLNWVLLALGVTMLVNLGVVCLLYLVYLEEAPRYRGEFDTVLRATLLFLGVAASATAAAFGHRWHKAWRWPAELLLCFSVIGTVWYFLPK